MPISILLTLLTELLPVSSASSNRFAMSPSRAALWEFPPRALCHDAFGFAFGDAIPHLSHVNAIFVSPCSTQHSAVMEHMSAQRVVPMMLLRCVRVICLRQNSPYRRMLLLLISFALQIVGKVLNSIKEMPFGLINNVLTGARVHNYKLIFHDYI